MSDDDQNKQQAWFSSIEALLQGIEVEFQREPSRRVSSYYVLPDLETQWIIKVMDECIADHRLSQIIEAIRAEGSNVMIANLNDVVILYKDLTFGVEQAD